VSNKVLIYGSKGFLASNFRQELERRNFPFIAVSRDALNMMDVEAVKEFVRQEHFDSVFFSVGPTPCKTQGMLLQNLELLNILLIALDSAGKSPKFTYISSDAVYGSIDSNPRTEFTNTAPNTLHGKMHLLRESILEYSGLTVLTLRSSAVFGIGDKHLSYGPNRFYHNLHNNLDIVLFGNGNDTRDHLWVKDFARAAADLHSNATGIFNLVSGHSSTFLEIAEEIARMSGVENKIRFENPDNLESDILYDNSKLTSHLGYQISDSLMRGLIGFFSQ
jgi:nucleoside-diphosphate-sugar epimerase